MNFFPPQPPELVRNLIFFLVYKIVIDVALAIYTRHAARATVAIDRKLAHAQRLRARAGTGMDRDPRRCVILGAYIERLLRLRAGAARQGGGPGALVVRVAPLLLSRVVFADRPTAVLRLPAVARLERSQDQIARLLVAFLQWGRRADEPWAPGYVSRTALSMIFGITAGRVIRRLVLGPQPRFSFRERLEMQAQAMQQAQA